MKNLVRDENENLHNKFMDNLKLFDNKIVRLRSEIDIHSI